MPIEFRSEAPAPAVPPSQAAAPLRTLPARADAFGDCHVSCVIPCLNECDHLRLLLPALRAQLQGLCTQETGSASCREREREYVWISVVAVPLKTKQIQT